MFKRFRGALDKIEQWANEDESDKQPAKKADNASSEETAVEAEPEPQEPFCYTNKTTTSPYTYTPLPTALKRPVRLLTLLPGSNDADIQCKLAVADLDSLDEGEGFEALSYVWGDAQNPTPIQIDGMTITVRKNLRSALLHLRDKDRPRTLWVDAVCINQTDTDECNSQVKLMGHIYTKAVRTVVWLGCPCCDLGTATSDLSSYRREKLKEEIEKVEALFAVIQLLGIEAADAEKEGRQVIAKKGEEYEGRTTYELISKIDPAWGLVLSDNPWWTRVWTLQEIVLAREVVLCMGKEEVGWHLFRQAIEYYKALGFLTFTVSWFGSSKKSGLEPLDLVDTIRSAREQQSDVGDELLFYLASSHWRKCEKLQDKIFGVLGLFNQNRDAGIEVDYRVDPGHLYHRATKTLLQRSGNFDAFGFCFPYQEASVPNLPSWVPDWGSSRNLALPLMNDAKGKLRTTHASGGRRSEPRWDSDDDRILIIQGHIVDVVAKLGGVQSALIMDDQNEGSLDYMLNNPDTLATLESFPATWDDVDPKHPYRHLASEFWKSLKATGPLLKNAASELTNMVTHKERFIEWQDLVAAELKGTGADYPNPNTVFRDTLTTSTFYPSGEAETQTRFEKWLDGLWSVRKLKGTKLDRVAPTTFKSLGFVSGLRKAVQEDDESFSTYTAHTPRRRLGITQKKRVCLLPKRASVDDKIVLLRGGRVPVVLRPRGDATFELVGEVYVHGIMNGEAFVEAECVDLRIS